MLPCSSYCPIHSSSLGQTFLRECLQFLLISIPVGLSSPTLTAAAQGHPWIRSLLLQAADKYQPLFDPTCLPRLTWPITCPSSVYFLSLLQGHCTHDFLPSSLVTFLTPVYQRAQSFVVGFIFSFPVTHGGWSSALNIICLLEAFKFISECSPEQLGCFLTFVSLPPYLDVDPIDMRV